MAEIEERWLSVNEICKYLGVSSNTMYRWIERFGMPAHRLGRLWKYKKDQVVAWVEASGALVEFSKEDVGKAQINEKMDKGKKRSAFRTEDLCRRLVLRGGWTDTWPSEGRC